MTSHTTAERDFGVDQPVHHFLNMHLGAVPPGRRKTPAARLEFAHGWAEIQK